MVAIRFPGVSRSAPSDEMQSFGPVVGVMKVASDEEAIQLMNYSSYGLTASVGSPLCPLDPGADLRAAVERITIRCTTLEIQLAEGMAEDSSDRILVIPWTPPAPYRRREIIQGEGRRSAAVRPMRAEARALLIDALRDAYCGQDELIRDSSRTIESIAAREKKTERSIRMTLSLAFLSPALVKAAIEGRLSRGFGVKRLMDLPMSWSDQWSVLDLKAPART
jgi:site-specific DNA recombinase